MNQHQAPLAPSVWKDFWDRGGWWKALGFVAVYLAIYSLAPFLFLPLTKHAVNADNVFATPSSVLAALALPLVIGSAVLIGFALSVRWLPRPLLGRQPVPARPWMWAAVVLVLIPVLLRLFGTDYSRYSGGVIAATFLSGALVGFSEELLTRGVVVTLLRRRGYQEWSVAALSSLLFALAHSLNVFTGQALGAVGFTLLYTFCFGVLMYLVMRVTGSIVWAMLLHALTDPTTMLATGGVDTSTASTHSTLLSLATPATVLLMVGAVVLLALIRGHANGRADAGEPARFPALGQPGGR